MRNRVRKALSLCMVLAMVMAMGTTALAAETKTYDLKKGSETTIGSMQVTNVISDTVSGGIQDGAYPTIKITKDSVITYDVAIEGVHISDSQGEPIFEKETVVKISNAKPINPDDEIITYQKGYTIQFITTGTYSVGINGEFDGMLGVGFFGVNFEVTDGSNSTPTTPTTPPANNTITATPTSSKVLVNGTAVEFDAYTINDNNYFKLRDVAKVVSGSEKQFEVTWNGTNNAIELVSGQPYTVVGGELAKGDGASKNATLNSSTVYKDGAVVELTAYTINDNNYFKLRDLGQAFNFNVSWDGANNCIVINTAEGYTAD